MSYSKLNLKNGQTLDQTHLAHIEDGIVATEVELAKKAAKSDIPDVSGLQPKGDYALKKDIPSVADFVTEEFVLNKIAEAELADKDVDLSGFYTKSEVDAKIADIEHPTVDLSSYVTDEELLEAMGGIQIPSTDGLATEEFVAEAIAAIEHPVVDLTNYAKKSEIPSVEGLASEKYVDDAIAGIETGKVNKVVDLAIFMGQSNMCGRGVAAQAPVVPEGWGYEFRAMSDPTKLYPIVEPFGVRENNPSSGVNESGKTGSMVSAFAIEYYKQTNIPLVAVSCAQGNTSAGWWQPTGAPFADAMARHDAAKTWLINNGYTIRHDFMVWSQGEADANQTAETYINWMKNIVTEAKTHGIEKCFNVRIGHVTTGNSYEGIIQAQNTWCKNSEDVVMASCLAAGFVELGLMKDIVHYTQEGYNIVGRDAGLHTAFYWKTGVEPYMLDPNEDSLYFPYADILAKVETDSSLDIYSTNPIQNRVVANLMESVNNSLIALQERMSVIENGGEAVYCNITYDLTNITSSNMLTSALMGSAYSCVLMPSNGADIITNIVVTMNGTDITLSCYANGTININNVTGDIVITAIGEVSDIEYLLNIDFTNTGVDALLSDGFMTADNPDTSLTPVQNQKGLYLNGAYPYGFTMAKKINIPENWALEYTVILDSTDAGHTGIAGQCHFGLLGNSTATSPFILVDQTGIQVRLDSSNARCELKELHLVDDTEHTYRIECNRTNMVGYRDGEQVSEGVWSQGTVSTRGYFNKFIGLNKQYIDNTNTGMFKSTGNHYIKSIKMWQL